MDPLKIEEKIGSLLNQVQKECPNLGSVACFMTPTHVMFRVHFWYPDEKSPAEKQEEDVIDEDDRKDPMDDGCKHAFMYGIDLADEDWDFHAKAMIDRYKVCMEHRVSA